MSDDPRQSAPRWAEPTSLLPLRWGAYRPRVAVGLSLIAFGVASVQITTAYSLPFLALGTLLQGVGWTVMPSAGWRRMTVFVPAILASCILLGGGGYAGMFAVILAAWMLVRHRPLMTYLLVIAPILFGATVSGVLDDGIDIDYDSGWIVLLIGTLISVACAWAARGIAAALFARRSTSGRGANARGTNTNTRGVDDADEASDAHEIVSRDADDLR